MPFIFINGFFETYLVFRQFDDVAIWYLGINNEFCLCNARCFIFKTAFRQNLLSSKEKFSEFQRFVGDGYLLRILEIPVVNKLLWKFSGTIGDDFIDDLFHEFFHILFSFGSLDLFSHPCKLYPLPYQFTDAFVYWF